MTIDSITNSPNNRAQATGDCNGLIQGYYVPATGQFNINGMVNSPVDYSGQKFEISTPRGTQTQAWLTVTTVKREEPKPVPTPQPAQPTPAPQPKQEPVQQPSSTAPIKTKEQTLVNESVTKTTEKELEVEGSATPDKIVTNDNQNETVNINSDESSEVNSKELTTEELKDTNNEKIEKSAENMVKDTNKEVKNSFSAGKIVFTVLGFIVILGVLYIIVRRRRRKF